MTTEVADLTITSSGILDFKDETTKQKMMNAFANGGSFYIERYTSEGLVSIHLLKVTEFFTVFKGISNDLKIEFKNKNTDKVTLKLTFNNEDIIKINFLAKNKKPR